MLWAVEVEAEAETGLPQTLAGTHKLKSKDITQAHHIMQRTTQHKLTPPCICRHPHMHMYCAAASFGLTTGVRHTNITPTPIPAPPCSRPFCSCSKGRDEWREGTCRTFPIASVVRVSNFK